MLTDKAILLHIERQPHGSAAFKQLVREMSLRGSERQATCGPIAGSGAKWALDRDRTRPLHALLNTRPPVRTLLPAG